MKAQKSLFVAVLVSPLLVFGLPSRPKKPHGAERVYETEPSKEEHFAPDSKEHNTEYDHDAFLGHAEAEEFSKLTPEESRDRLRLLIPKVDTDKNGYVTEEELKNWIRFTQNRYVLDDVNRQWKMHDVNGDDAVHWEEYRESTYGPAEDLADGQYKDSIDRDERRFIRADSNGDKRLIKEEFGAFLHPEEYEHMRTLIVDETVSDMDKNKDGHVTRDEYIEDLYPATDRKEGEAEPDWVQTERVSFSQHRDLNKDGLLDRDEIKNWILPSDYDHADAEAKHLIYESDKEPKDNQLTAEEIVEKYDLFAGSQATNYGEALNRHEEF